MWRKSKAEKEKAQKKVGGRQEEGISALVIIPTRARRDGFSVRPSRKEGDGGM